MYTEFNDLADSSKIWIYQSSRDLTDDEVKDIFESGKSFVNSWTAHNNALKGSISIQHNRFLILAVDEEHASASGCSIDKSVQFIREIEAEYSVDLFDRMKLAYMKEDQIQTVDHKDLRDAMESAELDEDDTVFNNLVETVGQWRKAWRVPFKMSWMYSHMKSGAH